MNKNEALAHSTKMETPKLALAKMNNMKWGKINRNGFNIDEIQWYLIGMGFNPFHIKRKTQWLLTSSISIVIGKFFIYVLSMFIRVKISPNSPQKAVQIFENQTVGNKIKNESYDMWAQLSMTKNSNV